MSTSLIFYNTLDDKMFQKMGFNEQPLETYYTNEENEIINMTVEPIEGQENTYHLVDPKVHWDPTMHNLNLKQEIEITNPSFLFGLDGLVADDAILGVAYRWYSRDSAHQQITPIFTFSKDENNLDNSIEITIEKGTLRGKVTFETLLFLASPGKYMSNIVSGTVLGILGSKDLVFDGDTSMFPIVEVNDSTKPLWWVDCHFEDPLYDQFSEENVSIVLNLGHKNARLLKTEKGIGSSPLLLEIIATGLQIIIEKAKLSGEWEQVITNQTEPGSIGEAIYYFINTFSWDTSSPENLLKSIREDFDKRF